MAHFFQLFVTTYKQFLFQFLEVKPVTLFIEIKLVSLGGQSPLLPTNIEFQLR